MEEEKHVHGENCDHGSCASWCTMPKMAIAVVVVLVAVMGIWTLASIYTRHQMGDRMDDMRGKHMDRMEKMDGKMDGMKEEMKDMKKEEAMPAPATKVEVKATPVTPAPMKY